MNRSLSVLLVAALATNCARAWAPAIIPLPDIQVPEVAGSQQDDVFLRLRDSIKSLSPARAASAARAQHNCQLLAVSGFEPEVPGLTGAAWQNYRFGIYVFPATSHYHWSDAQAQYQQAAFDYADSYNKFMLKARGKCKTVVRRGGAT